MSFTDVSQKEKVAPCKGAWIEMSYRALKPTLGDGRSLQGSVD